MILRRPSLNAFLGEVPFFNNASISNILLRRSIKNIEVLSDIHGSEEYRLHLAKVISARACNLAWDRLRN